MVYLQPCLIYLINLSLKSGEFPSRLKKATVIPSHKGGLKRGSSNWRPISLLPLFSKLYEKVMHKRLYNHLNLYGFLAKTQFGFGKGHSAMAAVHHLTDFVKSMIKRGELRIPIFIDLCKTFDTVVFKILLSRQRCLGVRDVFLN